jgi:single-strand DNA-binding protein
MLNKAILIGNLGRDPEIRTFQNGNRVANFSIATSQSWRDSNGERRTQTEWHRVSVLSDALVTVAEKYLKKGAKVYVEGKIETRKWEKEGHEHYTTEIVVRPGCLLLMLDSRDLEPADESSAPAEAAPDQPADEPAKQPAKRSSKASK